MKKTRKLPGMTVVELVMAVAILAIIVAVCTAILYTYLETHNKQEAMVKEELQVRQAMLTIAQELHKLEPDLGPAGERFTDEGVAIGFEPGPGAQISTASGLALFEAGSFTPLHDYRLMPDSAAADGSYKLEDFAAVPGPALIATGLAAGGFTVTYDLTPGLGTLSATYIKDVTISIKGKTSETGATWGVNIEDMVVRVYRGSM